MYSQCVKGGGGAFCSGPLQWEYWESSKESQWTNPRWTTLNRRWQITRKEKWNPRWTSSVHAHKKETKNKKRTEWEEEEEGLDEALLLSGNSHSQRFLCSPVQNSLITGFTPRHRTYSGRTFPRSPGWRRRKSTDAHLLPIKFYKHQWGTSLQAVEPGGCFHTRTAVPCLEKLKICAEFISGHYVVAVLYCDVSPAQRLFWTRLAECRVQHGHDHTRNNNNN